MKKKAATKSKKPQVKVQDLQPKKDAKGGSSKTDVRVIMDAIKKSIDTQALGTKTIKI